VLTQGRETQLDCHGGHRCDPPERLHERRVVDVDRRVGLRAVLIDEAQRHRQHQRARVDRGLQQRGVEMPEGAPVGGGAFRADRDQASGLEGRDHALVRAPRVAAIAALDEERPDPPDQVAHDRPVADLRFGDEQARHDGIHGENVEPGNVVRGEQAALRQRFRRVVAADLDP
jgi:hypothetical protein